MNQDHLSATEVAIFREDSFSSRSLEIGRHLLGCKECRENLPSITSQEFRNCVFDAEIVQHAEAESKHRFCDFINVPIASVARVTGFAGFTILLAAGIYFVGVNKFTTSETTVAQNDENRIAAGFNPIPEGPVAIPMSVESEDATKKETLRSDVTTNRANRKKEQGTVRRVVTKVPEFQYSEARGKLPCGGRRSVGLDARRTEAGLLLRWDKVRGAVLQNVYLSDLDEKLIARFETADQTSYVVTAELDTEKVYRLRLIVTLESGERIVSESQNFKVGDVAENSNSTGAADVQKKTAATVRCLEPNQ